jgi:hypothetical protein
MREIEKGAIYYFFIPQNVQKNKYTVIFQRILHSFITPVHELSDAMCEECFWLRAKPRLHRVPDIFIVCKSAST